MAQEPDLKLGVLRVANEIASPLPLKKTIVQGEIVGAVASVDVTQHFDNPFQTPVELDYLFALPHDAAVVDYQMTIGERVIRADLKEAKAAERAYEEAVEQGQRASLLEQRQPNLFSIRIGNVQPSEVVIVRLQYDERLRYRDGAYEFVFPMGITPKYHTLDMPPEEAARLDAPVTLDDSTVAPVELSLVLRPGLSIQPPTSRTHAIQAAAEGDQDYRITLAEHTIANKDFVLRYQAAAPTVQGAVWASRDGDTETALITLLPPPLESGAEPAAREFIFVIDRSGSMMTGPIEQAKNALRACIRALGEHDTFMMQAFSHQFEWFRDHPLPVTQANVDKADGWIEQVQAGGGTEILPALDAALGVKADPERQRYVVFLTDGAVSAADEAIRKVSRQRGQARIFTFGIGPAVNRYLLVKLAQMGRGVAEFLGLKDDIEMAMTRFQDRVSYPVLQDIILEWHGAEHWDTYPDVLPDLYIGQPLEIVTRLKRKAEARITLRGRLQSRAVEMTLEVPEAAETIPALQRLWARARIDALMAEERFSDNVRQQVIAVALEYRLATLFTSFVAIDSEITDTENAQTVKIAVPLPEGLDAQGFFSDKVAGGPAFMAAASTMKLARNVRSTGGRLSSLSDALPNFLRRSKADIPDRLGSFAASYSDATLADAWDSDHDAPARETEIPNTIEDRLKWLARTQNVDGSWDNAEMTAAALLAFVRAGHTTREGSYRRQVDKAARWLSGKLASLKGFELAVAVRALAELHAASGDYAPAVQISPTSELERATVETVTPPGTIHTLDDLRIAALVQGAIDAPDAMKTGPDRELVLVWLAVGKRPEV